VQVISAAYLELSLILYKPRDACGSIMRLRQLYLSFRILYKPLPAKVTDLHAGASQIATRLPRHCIGPARCCSQPASWYRSTAYGPTDRPVAWEHRNKSLGLHARIFGKCHYFRNDDPYRHKTHHMSCTWPARVCVKNFAIVRRGV